MPIALIIFAIVLVLLILVAAFYRTAANFEIRTFFSRPSIATPITPQLQLASGILTAAQLMNLPTQPIMLVPNQENTVIVFVVGSVQFAAGTVPYSVTGGGNIFAVSTDLAFTLQAILGGTDQIGTILAGPNTTGQMVQFGEDISFDQVAKNLYFGITTSGPTTISGGNGLLSYQIYYLVTPVPTQTP